MCCPMAAGFPCSSRQAGSQFESALTSAHWQSADVTLLSTLTKWPCHVTLTFLTPVLAGKVGVEAHRLACCFFIARWPGTHLLIHRLASAGAVSCVCVDESLHVCSLFCACPLSEHPPCGFPMSPCAGAITFFRSGSSSPRSPAVPVMNSHLCGFLQLCCWPLGSLTSR